MPKIHATVHVYPLSRLVHAPAGKWERLIADIEAGKEKAFAYYLPMREAVVLFCAKKGKDRAQIVKEMVLRARRMGGARGDKVAQDNEAAFSVFADVFHTRIKRYKQDLLREQGECEFEGVQLTGAPHFEVIDMEDRQRFVFLHPSNWSSEELRAYLELLAVIVEKRFGGTGRNLWCMDLRTGKEIKYKLSTRMRARCCDAARHYGRMITVMQGRP